MVLRRMAGLRLLTHPCFILGTRHNAIRSRKKRACRTRVWRDQWVWQSKQAAGTPAIVGVVRSFA